MAAGVAGVSGPGVFRLGTGEGSGGFSAEDLAAAADASEELGWISGTLS